jgi:hypothetical protein
MIEELIKDLTEGPKYYDSPIRTLRELKKYCKPMPCFKTLCYIAENCHTTYKQKETRMKKNYIPNDAKATVSYVISTSPENFITIDTLIIENCEEIENLFDSLATFLNNFEFEITYTKPEETIHYTFQCCIEKCLREEKMINLKEEENDE